MAIEITITYDYRTPEQKRATWKPRDYDPESDPYRNVPLPDKKMMRIMPHMISVNTPVGVFVRRKESYGESK
jgi:hypothetical protein